jgi:hypothetical protein
MPRLKNYRDLPINPGMNSVAGAQLAPDTDLDLGVAGASTRRQHERLREQIGWTAGSAVETGAEGEEELAAHLARACPAAIVLHDRALPGIYSSIDHLAVTAGGIWVIDAKRCHGKVEVRGSWRGEDRLMIAGHNSSLLVTGLAHQRDAVRAAIEPLVPGLPVHACFCFVNASRQGDGCRLPRLRTLSVGDFSLLDRDRLAKRVNHPGALSPDSAKEVAERLAAAFPRA